MFDTTSMYLQTVFAVLKNKSICKETQPREERISQKDMDTTDFRVTIHGNGNTILPKWETGKAVSNGR